MKVMMMYGILSCFYRAAWWRRLNYRRRWWEVQRRNEYLFKLFSGEAMILRTYTECKTQLKGPFAHISYRKIATREAVLSIVSCMPDVVTNFKTRDFCMMGDRVCQKIAVLLMLVTECPCFKANKFCFIPPYFCSPRNKSLTSLPRSIMEDSSLKGVLVPW